MMALWPVEVCAGLRWPIIFVTLSIPVNSLTTIPQDTDGAATVSVPSHISSGYLVFR
jgi:hypothetical protein